MELLSPAGNYEKLATAFNYGADAAYMGMTEFSLRANAGNFSIEEAEKVRALKAKTGKKVYCTLNILFREKQMEKLLSEKDEIGSWPFDAFIVSDIGTVPFLRKNFPEKELHLSTQASCLNSESVKMYRDMGFKRIILGREASLDDIRRIKDKVPEMELEAFVHGAMCMSYSGRCMLSSFLTGRSANRGDCSHTCRWNYRMYALEEEERKGHYYPIEENDGYTTILSSKDLCMIDHVKELEEAGLSSLKIEGRMKSVYYVAVVTRAYRKAIDDAPDKDEYKRDIFDVSHREFTTGFFFKDDPIEGREDDVSRPTSYGYERSYIFLGTIGKKKGENIWEIDCRNQIKRGQKLEFIGPDVPLLSDDNFTILDEDGFPLLQLDHMKKGFIKTDLNLKEGYIIRRASEQKYFS
ncbi:MAG: U32 family peptidase [Candidatus Ornithospirochaeta sp.]|nr:U32 family peptidase [Sphaerochaetaceae bacterium]MDY5524271.1 U32 family peptidase [Candidatus Ornithospirochaeta sp.]